MKNTQTFKVAAAIKAELTMITMSINPREKGIPKTLG